MGCYEPFQSKHMVLFACVGFYVFFAVLNTLSELNPSSTNSLSMTDAKKKTEIPE